MPARGVERAPNSPRFYCDPRVRLRPEGLLLVPLAFFAVDRHTKWALLLGLAVLVALTTRAVLPRARKTTAA